MLTLEKNYYISTALPTHKQQAMDAALFKQLLTQTESETLDFKREFPALPNDMAKSEFIKDIIAFYNTPRTEDAYIIYGVEESKGVYTPCGLDAAAPKPDEANLQQLIKDKASPVPQFSLAYFDYEGKHFAALKIPLPLTDKPARVLKDFGRLKQNELWRRVGSSSKSIVAADDIRIIETYFAERKTYVALKNYTQKLADEYDRETIMQEEQMTLADVYIEPMFGVYKDCFKKEAKKIKENEARVLLEFSFSSAEPFKLQEASLHQSINKWIIGKPFLNNIEVKNGDVILLLGNPGQGKTSFCKRLLHDYCQTYTEQLLAKPVFRIKFRNLTDVERLIHNPLDILFDYLKSSLPEIDRPLFNRSLLVLDGLDELVITENLPFSSIDQFSRNLLRSVEIYAQLTHIAHYSSRGIGFSVGLIF